MHYDTEENRVNEYGTEKLNQAHIENMIQKYKRLVTGSIDPTNVARYQARLDEWENRKAQLSVANSENSDIIVGESSSFDDSNRTFSVDWSVVDSEEYKNSLKEVSPKPKVYKAIQSRM